MKLINKIKSLLKKKNNKEINNSITKPLDIESFIINKNNETEKSFNKKIDSLYGELDVLLNQLEKDTQILSSADISHKKAHEKIKQITELGRIEYIAEINKLIENLRQKKGISHIKDSLDKFMIHSAKSHFKATQLIGKEIESVMKDIAAIRRQEVEFTNLSLIKEKEQINALLEKLNEKKLNEKKANGFLSEIEAIKHSNKELKNKNEEISKNIQKIKESEEYKKKESLTLKREEKYNSLKKIESELKSLIDKRLLEKYSYQQDKENKIASSYIEDPVKTLISDDNLKIREILEEIKEKIKNNSISIKEPDKTIEKIEKARENLQNYKTSLLLLNEGLKSIENSLLSIKINLKELIEEKSRIENKLNEEENKLALLEKKHEKTNSLISEINSYLSQEVLKTIPSP